MANPVQLLHTGGVPAPLTTVVYGSVSRYQPLPTTFTDPLYVVVDDWSEDYFYTIYGWPALWGSSMPTAKAPCLLQQDNRGNWRCVWWGDQYVKPIPACGSITLTWDGTHQSTVGTATHNLGFVPQAVTVTPTWTTSDWIVVANLEGIPTTTTMDIVGWAPQGNPPSNDKATIWWTAM